MTIENDAVVAALSLVTATLNDDSRSRYIDDEVIIIDRKDTDFVVDKVLHPYMKQYGSEGGLYLVNVLADFCADLVDRITENEDVTYPEIMWDLRVLEELNETKG